MNTITLTCTRAIHHLSVNRQQYSAVQRLTVIPPLNPLRVYTLSYMENAFSTLHYSLLSVVFILSVVVAVGVL